MVTCYPIIGLGSGSAANPGVISETKHLGLTSYGEAWRYGDLSAYFLGFPHHRAR
jgi:hypothetical protein